MFDLGDVVKTPEGEEGTVARVEDIKYFNEKNEVVFSSAIYVKMDSSNTMQAFMNEGMNKVTLVRPVNEPRFKSAQEALDFLNGIEPGTKEEKAATWVERGLDDALSSWLAES